MCPICWINGFLALLFGASAFSFGTEWYIVIPSVLLLVYGCYKIWDGIKLKFEERDFLKAEGDRLHSLFSKCREDADAVHAQIEELRSQVTEVKNELKALREERKSWITIHNKSVEESTSNPKDDAELADSLVSKLMGSGALSLGGAAGAQSPEENKPTKRKGRRTTAPRRGNKGRSKKSN